MKLTRSILKRFRRDETGAMLTEFAIALPIILLVFGLIVESGRIFWGYQSAVSGVRDASRYMARTVPVDICTTGIGAAGQKQVLTDRISKTIRGSGAFPASVTLQDVRPTVTCIPGTYRINPVPVANVVADVQIRFPFSGAMKFFGKVPTTLTTQIDSQSRIFGL